MANPQKVAHFLEHPKFKFSLRSLLLFIVLAVVAWGINLGGQMIFSSQNMVPYLARTVITMILDLTVVFVSIRLLKKNGLPSRSLGLSIKVDTLSDILVGVLIGILAVSIIAGMLYVVVPYHFIKGTFSFGRVLQETISYFAGNSLEELLFRGFLFVVLSQLLGWRIALLIVSLGFGLFHLQGVGFTVRGAKLVATTALFGLIFGMSYVLTKSLWTAVFTHATSNILLHAFAGLDGGGKAMFVPVFERPWPIGYDLGLWLIVIDATVISCLLYGIIYRTSTAPGWKVRQECQNSW